MDIISKALEVAEDYPVFPCDSKKRPVCQGGFKAATQDPDEIERLFAISGAALIGIPTGEVSGVSVIDIDVRDGKQAKNGGEKMQKCLELQGSLKRNRAAGIIIIVMFLIFEIALVLMAAWMSGEMGAMLSTLKALVTGG